MKKSTLELTSWDVNYLFNMFKNFDWTDYEREFSEDRLIIFKNKERKLITHVMSLKDILDSIENITGLTMDEFGKYKRSFILDDTIPFYELVGWFYHNDFIHEETYKDLIESYDVLEEYEDYLFNKSVVEEYELDSLYYDRDSSDNPEHIMVLEDMNHPRWKTSLVSLWNVVGWINPTENESLSINKRKVVEICQSFITLKRFEISFDKLLSDLSSIINRQEGDKVETDKLLENLDRILDDLYAKINNSKKGIEQEEFANFLEDCVKKLFKVD